ncbi:MAG: GAF domain-containing protein [Ktedonobacteraceae bacterium]|jgi:hypothetical protein
MDEPQNWRELLGRVISDPLERHRIATTLGVNAITLSRWASNSSTPRSENIRHLIEVLPQQQHPGFVDLIADEFPEFSAEAIIMDEGGLEIPSSFYACILSTHADTSDALYYWSMCKLILQQMLEQLDPRRLGMMIMVAQCTPPVGQNKVRSLRGNMRLGTFPVRNTLEQEAMFLGAETLCGSVASSCRPLTLQSLDEENGLHDHIMVDAASITAYPILRKGRIAGCILITSTCGNYFTSNRLALIQNYTNLLALAFQPEEFYDPKDIQLGIMPAVTAQKPYFATFRQRIADVMRMSLNNRRPINIADAEQLVWQQLEEDLLHLNSHVVSG